jgi:pimeloyl-ACP methyl ester carboxylesterase
MDTEIFTLSDGRQLGFAQFGDLAGQPLFFFHGTPGSCFFHPPDQITSCHAVRLITVDRPGYGLSTFQAKRKITNWPIDIQQLADHLHLDSFMVAGHSGGGPYVFACAHALPGHVTAAAVISAAGPVEAIGAGPGLSFVNRLGFQFGRYIPWPIWYPLIRTIYRSRSKDPWQDMDRQAGYRPPSDSELMNIPEIRNICYQSELQAFKPGLRGFAWDTRLLTRSWGFHLEDIKVPVSLWHGLEDNMTPVAMAHHLVQKITSCRPHFIPGEAHLLLFKYWEEILTDLISLQNK